MTSRCHGDRAMPSVRPALLFPSNSDVNTSHRVGVAREQDCGNLNHLSLVYIRKTFECTGGILCILKKSSQPKIQFKLIIMMFLRRRIEYSINCTHFLRLRSVNEVFRINFICLSFCVEYLITRSCLNLHFTFVILPILMFFVFVLKSMKRRTYFFVVTCDILSLIQQKVLNLNYFLYLF